MSILRTLENAPGFYYFECPQCGLMTEVETNQLNCKIFRHGGQATFDPIPPHARQGLYVAQPPDYTQPEWPLRQGQIYGCGLPFEVVTQGKCLVARICGWK